MSRDQSVLGADHGGADECEQAAGRAVQHGDEDQDESRTRHQRQRRECQVGVAPAEPLPQRRGERGTHHGDGGRAKHATWGHHQARAPPLQQPSRSDAGHGTGEAARGERPCDRRWRPAGVRGDSRCEHSEGVVEDAIADRDTRTERHESPSSSPGREQATAPGRSSRSPCRHCRRPWRRVPASWPAGPDCRRSIPLRSRRAAPRRCCRSARTRPPHRPQALASLASELRPVGSAR